MSQIRDYGELMRFLLHHRERCMSDEEFNEFVVSSLRQFVYDLRDFDVYISISPDSIKQSRPADIS